MIDKQQKSADKGQKPASKQLSQLQAALAKAEQDIVAQLAAKQKAAYMLKLLSKDDLAGELSASLVKGLAEQYEQLVQQASTAKQSHGRLKQLDMHPLSSNDFMHVRHHANRSLGSEAMYHAFMEGKAVSKTSLNQALTSYMFANTAITESLPGQQANPAAKTAKGDELAPAAAEPAEVESTAKGGQRPKPKQAPAATAKKYTVRLYMVSRHSENLADLSNLDKPNGDRICSQATWTNPVAQQYKLYWKELSDPSLYSQYTELKYDAETEELSIVRPGEFFLKLDFKLGRILQSTYHTPYGEIPMITQTEQLACDLSRPEQGYVELLYFLSNDNQNGHYVSIDLHYELSQAPLTQADFTGSALPL